MPKKILAALAALVLTSSAALWAQSPVKANYEAEPFLAAVPNLPQVMLVMAKDHKMFYQAYTNLADLDGDGKIDIGFNPSIEYFGYFDPYGCYEYKAHNGDVQRFEWRERAASGQRDKPSAVADSVEAPPSIAYCSVSNQWSGNWLNWATASRMDAIRKVLYGGMRLKPHTRKADEHFADTGETVLAASYIPRDAHVWGVEVVADDLWGKLTPFSPYYNLNDYTEYAKPGSSRIHYFGRISEFGYEPTEGEPQLRMVFNVPYYENHATYNRHGVPGRRMWDWALGETPILNPQGYQYCNRRTNQDPCTANSGDGWANLPGVSFPANRKLLVLVCDQEGNREGCQQYAHRSSSGLETQVYKPVGLLQKYSGTMRFGLITGAVDNTLRKKGGKLRHHIDSLSASVDPVTGEFVEGGLIDTLERLEITGWDDGYGRPRNKNSNLDSAGNTTRLTTWGNPLGEMVWEAVRYFAGTSAASSPTSAYSGSETERTGGKRNALQLPVAAWASRPALSDDSLAKCSSPVIMVLSDVYPEFDSDDVPGSPFGSLTSDLDSSDPPIIKGLSGFGAFSMSDYLAKVTAQEGFSNQKYFVAQKYGDSTSITRGECTPKTIDNLANVRGLCPSDPAREGSYSIVAAAYYGRTHDFSGQGSDRPIDFYAVALSSAYPELKFTLPGSGGEQTISILPASISPTDQRTAIYGFINYFIEEWHTDSNNLPFRVKIRVNFEDSFEGSDYDRDGFATYVIQLVSNGTISGKTDDSQAVNIESGPLHDSGVQHYGFKNNNDGSKITLTASDVAGLAVTTDSSESTMGWNMLIGYTINGAQNAAGQLLDGTYMDTHVTGTGNNNALSDHLNTPWQCQSADGSAAAAAETAAGARHSTCGQAFVKRTQGGHNPDHPEYRQTRSFMFSASGAAAEFLPDPLWLAAKYGGFLDSTKTGNPNSTGNRWSVDGQDPENYFRVNNMTELGAKLEDAFSTIARKASTSTATSASVNSILGGGIAIRTLYYPQYTGQTPNDSKSKVNWLGTVYGLFVDKWGNLREDTNGNKILDVVSGPENPGNDELGDYILVISPSDTGPPTIQRWRDEYGNNKELVYVDTVTLEQVQTVWNTGQWLADIVPYSPGSENNFPAATRNLEYDASLGRRIFFGGPAPNVTGSAPSPTLGLFDSTDPDRVSELAKVMLQPNSLSKPVTLFSGGGGGTLTVMLYGQRSADKRVVIEARPGTSSAITASTSETGTQITYRLRYPAQATAGDLAAFLNSESTSQPLLATLLPLGDEGNWALSGSPTVTMPTRDESAAALIDYVRGQAIDGWRSREVIYPWPGESHGSPATWRMGDIINSKPIIVGSVAANYDLLYGDSTYYTYKAAVSGRRQVAYAGSNSGMLHAINLGFFGSLSTGTAGYTRSNDRLNPNLGHELGAEMWAYVPAAALPHLQWLPNPQYRHNYYVDLKPLLVDVKDPSAEHGWRTMLIGGLRLGGRTIDVAKDDPKYSYSEFFALDVTDPEKDPVLLWRYSDKDMGLTTAIPTMVTNNGRWYVIFASGPNSDPVGENSEGVGPVGSGLSPYAGNSNRPARLYILDALTGEHLRTINEAKNGAQTVPLNNSFFNDSFTPVAPRKKATRSVTGEVIWHNHTVYFGLTTSRDSAGLDKGAVYRLQMVKADGTPMDNVSDWELKLLFQTDRPVTGAVNSTYDHRGNLWVVFGSGRMWGEQDLTPCLTDPLNVDGSLTECQENHVQYLYGLKEPLEDGEMTFEPVADDSKIVNVSGAKVFTNGYVTDIVLPRAEGDPETAPNITNSYDALKSAMLSDGTNGYKRRLDTWSVVGSGEDPDRRVFEMNLYQPKIDAMANGGSFTAFTTFKPDTDVCNPEGQSFLHVVDTYTGLPAPYMDVFQTFLEGDTLIGTDGEDYDQVTGYIAAGPGMSTEAVIIKTEEGTRIETTVPDGSNPGVWEPNQLSLTSSIISWREVLDMGFKILDEDMTSDLTKPDPENPGGGIL